MSRWKKEDKDLTWHGSLYMREWLKTANGLKYKKRQSEYTKQWRKKNKEKFHATQKACYAKVRLEALTHYSKGTPKCACCGEDKLYFLSIDHIKGNGNTHRKQLGMRQGGTIQSIGQKHKVTMGGNGFVYWLKKNEYPKGYQVLCYNCNFAKRQNSKCPCSIHTK